MRAILVPHSRHPGEPAGAPSTRRPTPWPTSCSTSSTSSTAGTGVATGDARRRAVDPTLHHRRASSPRPPSSPAGSTPSSAAAGSSSCRPCCSGSRRRRRRSCSRRTSSARSSGPRRARSPTTGGSVPTCAPPCRWRRVAYVGSVGGALHRAAHPQGARSTRSSSSARRRRRLHARSSPTWARRRPCGSTAHGTRCWRCSPASSSASTTARSDPGTGSFLVFALVGLMGYAFLEASAKAKIANFATNLGALTVFVPGGYVMCQGRARHGRRPTSLGGYARRPDRGGAAAAGSCAWSSSSSCRRSSCGSAAPAARAVALTWLMASHEERTADAQDCACTSSGVTTEPVCTAARRREWSSGAAPATGRAARPTSRAGGASSRPPGLARPSCSCVGLWVSAVRGRRTWARSAARSTSLGRLTACCRLGAAARPGRPHGASPVRASRPGAGRPRADAPARRVHVVQPPVGAHRPHRPSGYAAGTRRARGAPSSTSSSTTPGMLLAVAGTVALAMVVVTSVKKARAQAALRVVAPAAPVRATSAPDSPSRTSSGPARTSSRTSPPRSSGGPCMPSRSAASLVFRLGLPLVRSWRHRLASPRSVARPWA